MNGYIKALTALTAGILGVLLALGGAVLTGVYVAQQKAKETPPMERRFPVQGSGVVRVKPDLLRCTIRFTGRGATATEAQEQVRERMKRLLLKLTALGVAEKDLQTGDYGLQPVYKTERTPAHGYEYTRPGVRHWVSYPDVKTIKSFMAQNTLEVKFRQVDRAGLLIDAAIAAGAESVENVRFDVEDVRPLRQRARALAAANARERAEAIAEGAGARLGRVISLSETPGPGTTAPDPWAAQNAQIYQPRGGMGGGGMMGGSGAAPPDQDEDSMEPGMLEVSARVYAVYELE